MHIVRVVLGSCDKYVTRHFTTSSEQKHAARFDTACEAARHAEEFDRRQGVHPARKVKLRRRGSGSASCRRRY